MALNNGMNIESIRQETVNVCRDMINAMQNAVSMLDIIEKFGGAEWMNGLPESDSAENEQIMLALGNIKEIHDAWNGKPIQTKDFGVHAKKVAGLVVKR